MGQLGAGVSADRASLLMAATHTINSAPLSLESVTMSAWLWGCGWEWTGQDRKSTSKLLQEMFRPLSAVSSVQDDPCILFTPPENLLLSLSLGLPSPSTDSTEASILTWLSPMVTHVCCLLSSRS